MTTTRRRKTLPRDPKDSEGLCQAVIKLLGRDNQRAVLDTSRALEEGHDLGDDVMTKVMRAGFTTRDTALAKPLEAIAARLATSLRPHSRRELGLRAAKYGYHDIAKALTA
ncbi:MAG: hypothetical protein V1716_01725 [Candidatus Uhrbacteria bacterium]